MAKIDITKTVQNFGKIKNAYNEILVESVVAKNKDKKDLFKSYVKTIKENEALKNQFLVYNIIENNGWISYLTFESLLSQEKTRFEIMNFLLISFFFFLN